MLVASPVLCDKDYSAQPSHLGSKDKHFMVLLFANIVLHDLSQFNVFFIANEPAERRREAGEAAAL